MQRDLTALFGRFRDSGDTEALGRAFDECGAELLRVARHLGTSREDAEDLVQATFLTAIEKAGTLERGREPMPWLVGILVLHARNLRRKRGRTTELPELARHEPPDEVLERAELRVKVAEALQELPKRYAQVLAPYLAGEFSSGEIGAMTGRAPGTVRMQIHRGLELLRRALGNTFLACFVEPPRLRRVRSELLESACRARGFAVPATKVAVAPIAALFAALALLVLGGVRWFGASAESATHELAAAATLDPTVAPTASSSSAAAFSTGFEARVEPDRAAGSNLALRGLRGRLVDGAGGPLAGIEVRLGVISIEWSNKPIDRLSTTPEVERSRCVTDSDGRFVLTGARRGDMTVLGIDCGGPRGHLHWIQDSPTPTGELDLGDVSLGARVAVTGRVVDADGVPLAGVRVRPGLEARGIRSFSSASIASELRGKLVIQEAAAWVWEWFERFPVPTVRSGTDGRFRVELPASTTALHFDRTGFVESHAEGLELAAGAVELGDVRMERGRTVQGRVLDDEGTPLAGVEVRIGVEEAAGQPATMFAATTDVEGRFERSAIATSGPVIVAARRKPTHAWQLERFESVEKLELRLAATSTLVVHVRDATGSPLDDVEVQLVPLAMPKQRPTVLARCDRDLRRGNGDVTFDALAPGNYFLWASKPGFLTASESLELGATQTEVTLSLGAAPEHRVLVVDGRDGAPVSGARVLLVAWNGMPRTDATTGADGVARLTVAKNSEPREQKFHVWHPEFAVALDMPLLLQEQPQRVELGHGGSLRVQVLERGRPVATPRTFRLEVFAFEFAPLQATTDALGFVNLDRVAPRTWRYDLLEPPELPQVLERVEDSEQGVQLSGRVGVRANERTELVLELVPGFDAPEGSTARVQGRAQLDGTTNELYIELRGTREVGDFERELALDASGAFDFGWLKPGRYVASLKPRRITDEDPSFTPWRGVLELAPGEVRKLDLQLARIKLELHVVDTDEKPVPDAHYEFLDSTGRRLGEQLLSTDADGRGAFRLYQPGDYSLFAEHPTRGYAESTFKMSAGEKQLTLELKLDPGVACSGTLSAPGELLAGDTGGGRSLSLYVRRVDAPSERSRHVRVPADAQGRGKFSLSGLRPGRYGATLGVSGPARAIEIEFELGPEGARGLAFDFKVQPR